MLISRGILSLICSFAIYFVSASTPPEKKSFMSKEMKRKFFGDSKRHSNVLVQEDVKPSGSKALVAPNVISFSFLPNEITLKIFEYLIEDQEYITLRLVCKKFRRIYDDVYYKMAISIFPALSKWNNERFAKTLMYKYELIPLSHAIFFYIDLLKAHQISISGQNLLTVTNLSHNSVQLITFIQNIDLESCLKLANSLLKLKIVKWNDINDLLFPDTNKDAIQTAWSLGLTTIARTMYANDNQKYYKSIAYKKSEGLVMAINGRRFAFSKLMISNLSSKWFKDNYEQLRRIITALVDVENWELLYKLCETERNIKDYSSYRFDRNIKNFNSYRYCYIAETGKIEGLRRFRNLVKFDPSPFARYAAKNGHIEFLKEMDALKLFRDRSSLYGSVASAFEGAVCCSSSECLDWLVKRFGKKFLCCHIGCSWGTMLIHYAAEYGNPETLRAIMRHYPFYRRIILRFSVTINGSPLHIAVSRKKYENVQFLLENFPQFIKFKDWQNNTALHKAIGTDCRIFRMLLDVAPRRIITARNKDGDTVLHLAARDSTLEMISLLMNTGYFTGMERNDEGQTPVYQRGRFRYDHAHAMEVFRLHSEEQVIEALKINYSFF